MADESLAVTVSPPPATEAEYEAIAAAVMETGRGRWFLAEYARRNRSADTEILLAALKRIEAAIRREPTSSATAAMRSARAEMKPDVAQAGNGAQPRSFASTLENAAVAIRAATERLQDVAWRLREQQYDDKFCDEIDASTRDIAVACALLEDSAANARRTDAPAAEPDDRADTATPRSAPPDPQVWASEAFAPQESLWQLPEKRARPDGPILSPTEPHALTPDAAPEPAIPSPEAATIGTPASARRRDPLAPIRALSEEEKIALFS